MRPPASWRSAWFVGVALLVVVPGAAASTVDSTNAETMPEICADFTAIVEGSAREFEGVRGELISQHLDPLSDTRVVWRCSRVPTGANSCEVEWTDQTLSYHAYWNRESPEETQRVFEALAELLTACGFEMRQSSKSGKSLWIVQPGDSDLDITLAHSNHRTRLTFSRLGVPAPAPAPRP